MIKDEILGAASATPTMLRLIPPFGGSDGRFVHITVDKFILMYKIKITFKSSFYFVLRKWPENNINVAHSILFISYMTT